MNVESEEFKSWFKQSKVVDGDKNPLPVYHGTTEDFDLFITDPLERSSVNGVGQNAIGSCFSESEEIASFYPFSVRVEKTRKVIKSYLSIQNPKKYRTINAVGKDIISFCEKNNLSYAIGGAMGRLKNVALFKEDLIKRGYDGITYMEGPPQQITKNKERVWVAFHPEQIKIVK